MAQSVLRTGDRVSILLEADIFQMMQEDLGWQPAMGRCLNRIGTITDVQFHTVEVEFGAGEKWNLNPAVLSAVMPFEVGNRVKVIDDERRLKELQRDHGGWVDAMISTVGQEGVVKRVFGDQDLRVEVAESSWTFNPNALIPIGPPTPRTDFRPVHTIPSLSTLFDSVAAGDIETIKAIVHPNPQLLKESVNGLNALHIACQGGQEDIVSFLMGQGMDPNQPDTQGKTPLMFCCEVVHNPLCVRHLLQAGAKPNDCGKLNNTYPLLLAIEFNLSEICKELLDSRKCNVNVRDKFSQDTALHIAARISNLNIVMNLLDEGADPYVVNSAGLLPIHSAIIADSQKVIEYILSKIPDLVYMKAKRGEYLGLTAIHIAILKDKKECLVKLLECEAVDLELRDDHYQHTPFLFAVAEKKYHMIDVLLQNGCDIYAHDRLGNNALHILFSSNCDNYNEELINDPILSNTYKEVEQYFGAHMRITMCCYLIKIRVPYQRKNAAGVHPLLELSPDIRRFCEDRAPGLLPDCTLCDRLSEFKNSPCEHVTYCVVHAIDGSRCTTCGASVASYLSLVPYANTRRHRIQGMNRRRTLWSPVIPSDMPVDAYEMPTYMPSPPMSAIPPVVKKAPEPALPNPTTMKEESGGGECGICYESFRKVLKVAVDPCGHTCCKVCGDRLKDCHICRQPILKLLPVYDN